MLLQFNKKAQSEVISTVLMILIGIIAVSIIAVFAINFVNEKKNSAKCFDTIDLVIIENNPTYNCYNSSELGQRVQIHFSDANSTLEGIKIELGGSNTKGYTITSTSHSPNVTMFSNPNDPVELPGDNEERTYKIKGVSSKPDVIRVYPILRGGKICQSSSTLKEIGECH